MLEGWEAEGGNAEVPALELDPELDTSEAKSFVFCDAFADTTGAAGEENENGVPGFVLAGAPNPPKPPNFGAGGVCNTDVDSVDCNFGKTQANAPPYPRLRLSYFGSWWNQTRWTLLHFASAVLSS